MINVIYMIYTFFIVDVSNYSLANNFSAHIMPRWTLTGSAAQEDVISQ